MKTTRILVVLVSLTIAMQGIIMFRQYRAAIAPRAKPPVFIRNAPAGTEIDISDMPYDGDKAAKTILIEFSDFECPFCARHATGPGKVIRNEYVSKGLLRHVFINNPLPEHSQARNLATVAICAGRQGKYWEMYDALFGDKPRTKDQMLLVSKKLKLNMKEMAKCVGDIPSAAARIDEDAAIAKRLSLTGTPSFALAHSLPNGIVSVDKFLIGAQSKEFFNTAIQDELRRVQ